MNLPAILFCPGNLSPVENGSYSPDFLREMFDGIPISHLFDFPLPGKYLSNPEYIHLTKRLAVPGVQAKYLLKLENNRLLTTSRQGQYILKPAIDGIQYAQDIPANEHLTMQIARQVYDISTASNGLVFYQDGKPAYLCKRFDRKPDGSKLLQEDFVQLAGRSPNTHGNNYKYDFSYEELASLIKQYAPAAMPELEKFFRLVIFNYLFSNGDAHLKNFSLIESPQGDFVLSPAYDLLCTRIHLPNEASDMAPSDGLFTDYSTASFDANGFYAYDDFYEFGIKIGLIPKRVERFLGFFRTPQAKVYELINRSYLSDEAKTAYTACYEDRLFKRLNYSFTKKIQ